MTEEALDNAKEKILELAKTEIENLRSQIK